MASFYLSAFTLFSGILNVASMNKPGDTQVIYVSNSITETPTSTSDYTLSLSRDWALRFDEELGRGDSMTQEKQEEIHNNLLEAAEILHIIPKGSASQYKDLAWKLESDPSEFADLSKMPKDYEHEDFPVSVEELRRHGIKKIVDAATHLSHGNQKDHSTKAQQDDMLLRKYSPRLAMFTATGNAAKPARNANHGLKRSWKIRERQI